LKWQCISRKVVGNLYLLLSIEPSYLLPQNTPKVLFSALDGLSLSRYGPPCKHQHSCHSSYYTQNQIIVKILLGFFVDLGIILKSINHASWNVCKYGECCACDDGSSCACDDKYEVEPSCKSKELSKTDWILDSIIVHWIVNFLYIISFI